MTSPRSAFVTLEKTLGKPGLADVLQRIHEADTEDEVLAAVNAGWESYPDVLFDIVVIDRQQEGGQ